jgi:hypothetical protein
MKRVELATKRPIAFVAMGFFYAYMLCLDGKCSVGGDV